MMASNRLLGKKVLVTGASGFIGSYLCQILSDEKAEVHGISRSPHTVKADLISWWKVDLEDISSAQAILRKIKPDIIYHLASNVIGSRSFEYVLPTLYSNLVSTVNLLKSATEIGCSRIILAGSLEEPIVNELPLIPSSPYAASKWASSAYAQMFHQLYQTPVVIAKIFMVYGPKQNSRFLIPYVISSLLEGKSPQLTSGNRPVDWIYVEDVVAGLLAMGTKPDLEGKTIDLGSGTLVTVHELVQQLGSIVNPDINLLFGTLEDRPLEQIRVAKPSTSYIQLGWQAKRPLKAGLKLTVDWYKGQLEKQRNDDKT